MSKETIVIYDDAVSGHHMEYLHHLYMETLGDNERQWVFAVPTSFEEVKGKFDWPKEEHISIHTFDDIVEKPGIVGKVKHFVSICLGARRAVKRYNANAVFFNLIEWYMPLLPFIMPRGVRITGILYQIYLFEWKQLSIWGKVYRLMRYLPYKLFRSFTALFILNSAVSARVLNRRWGTSCFHYLPDPFVITPADITSNAKEEVQHEEGVKVMLHFGAMHAVKGTLHILDSMAHIPASDYGRYHFVFAGRVGSDIKESFYGKVEHYRKKGVRITFYDEFCPYEQISHLVAVCDCILMPYYRTSQSSGQLGYAIAASKPVILPRQGMLEKLGREAGIGIYIEKVSAEALAAAYNQIDEMKIDKTKQQMYLNTHSAKEFSRIIHSAIING